MAVHSEVCLHSLKRWKIFANFCLNRGFWILVHSGLRKVYFLKLRKYSVPPKTTFTVIRSLMFCYLIENIHSSSRGLKKYTRSGLQTTQSQNSIASNGEGNGTLTPHCSGEPRDGEPRAAGLCGCTDRTRLKDLAASGKWMISKSPKNMDIYLFINYMHKISLLTSI